MEIQNLIQSGESVMLIVKPDDLKLFADYLVERMHDAKLAELDQQKQAQQEEKFLSTDEVKKIFDVCDTTLWSWHKNGLLRHRKFGKRNMYALSDIRHFMDDHVNVETVSGYAKWHGKVHPPE